MTALGRAAVWIALIAGLAAAGAPLVGRRGRASVLLALSTVAAVAATGVLVRALVVGDHSLVYVADFSRRDASAPYRAAALWGGMAGSLLWLATLVGVAGLVAAWRLDDRRRRDGIAAVTGAVAAVLVLLVVGFADPFRTLAVPAVDGAGLAPILERTHPAPAAARAPAGCHSGGTPTIGDPGGASTISCPPASTHSSTLRCASAGRADTPSGPVTIEPRGPRAPGVDRAWASSSVKTARPRSTGSASGSGACDTRPGTRPTTSTSPVQLSDAADSTVSSPVRRTTRTSDGPTTPRYSVGTTTR